MKIPVQFCAGMCKSTWNISVSFYQKCSNPKDIIKICPEITSLMIWHCTNKTEFEFIST